MRLNVLSNTSKAQFDVMEGDILCSGWRIDCPYDGVFNQNSKECEDCNNEALKAMEGE